MDEIESLRALLKLKDEEIAELKSQLRDKEILAKPVQDYMPTPITKKPTTILRKKI